jgi:hypothetical protein
MTHYALQGLGAPTIHPAVLRRFKSYGKTSPAALFSNGEQGAWYDPSDFSTMFQDSAGTTPVTAVEQPVGLIRDKSGRGNHASQSTSAARPTLRARYNLLTYSGLTGAAAGTPGTAPTSWPLVTSTGTIDSASASDGAGGNILAVSASVGRHIFGQTTPTMSASTVYNATMRLEATSGLQFSQLTTCINLPAGATAEPIINGTVVAGTAVPVAGDTIGHKITISTTAGTASFRFGVGCSSNSTGSASFSRMELRAVNDGVGLPVYQRIAAATDYDTAGFPPYLAFDGTDDSLATSAIDFSATDEMTVVAGVRKLSDAAQGAIAELTASIAANNGSFLLAAPDGATATYGWDSKGTTQIDAVASSQTAPITGVVTGTADISGDTAIIRVNGTQADSDTSDQGTGNYSNAALYIGSRNSASLRFNGRLYGLIIRGKTTDATQLAQVENWMNTKTRAF